MRSWAWALGVLAGITALLATTASAELWILFVSSGSGKTAPVHQPHVVRERAERDRDARAKSEHEHKLRGSFGSGVVVPADDPAPPPPPPPPPADAEEETTDDYDIEKVEIPPRASEDAAPSSSNVEPPRSDDANATKMDDDDRRRSRSETKTAASRSMLYTWGIGGARVGRPSDPSPTPPGRAEGDTAGDGDFDPLTAEIRRGRRRVRSLGARHRRRGAVHRRTQRLRGRRRARLAPGEGRRPARARRAR